MSHRKPEETLADVYRLPWSWKAYALIGLYLAGIVLLLVLIWIWTR